MKLFTTSASSCALALLLLDRGVEAGGGGGRWRAPPSKCSYHKRMLMDQTVYQNGALCDGGWKFGINKNGIFGLWDDEGKLVEKYRNNAKWMELYEDDDDVALYVFPEDSGAKDWSMYCSSDQKYEVESGKIKLVMNAKKKNIVKLTTATDAPFDKLMRIKKNGKVKLNKRFCRISMG